MTDKQIIIDDVDIAGCEDYGYRGKAGYWCHNYDEPCTDYPNCLYKQLKRKEQECKNNKIAHQMELDIYNQECLNLQEALKAKEQECEELKEKYKWYDHYKEQALYNKNLCNEKSEQLDQLKQTLSEIKEVLQLYNNITIGTYKGNGIFEFEVSNDNVLGGKLIYCYDTNPAKKALQKISECEM